MTTRTLHIAGVTVRFCGDEAASAILDRRYRTFLVDGDARDAGDAIEIELRLRAPAPAGAVLHEALFSAAACSDRVVFAGPGVRAELSTDLSRGFLEAPLAERAIDALLRFLLAERLLARGALLLHASAVTIGGRAWVFSGPSGVGKTTLGVTLEGSLLCDETVAIAPADGGAIVHSTPYWHARPGAAEVAGVIFPVRGVTSGRPSWRTLPPGRAVARLMSSSGPLLASSTPRVLAVAATILRALPCAEVTLCSIADIRNWLQPRLRTSVVSAHSV